MPVRISVCVATYNGKQYLCEQLDSILSQLSDEDEVIVVDDFSTDGTYELLAAWYGTRVKLFRNEQNLGVNSTFENAIRLARGRYIFLSDQDDVWTAGRVETMLHALSQKKFVSSNFELMDKHGSIFYSGKYRPLREKDSCSYLGNLVGIFLGQRNYYGCAMAFHRELVSVILPIPKYVESHDLWIAIAANLLHSVSHLEDKTLMRRIHGDNVSVITRPVFRKFWARVVFVRSIIDLGLRLNSTKKVSN